MKEMMDIGISDVKNVLKAKGYSEFTAEGVPNIVGIRADKSTINLYDDRCWVWWLESGIPQIHNYTITTHPGNYYLTVKLLNADGCAILVPGQYEDCWTLGMHRGKQFALCQRAGEVKVYRDKNRDKLLDYDPATIDTGYFGIDLHHGALDDSDIVDRYSAGCQVWRYHEPHEALMSKLDALSHKYGFSKFSYTLLEQKDFNT